MVFGWKTALLSQTGQSANSKWIFRGKWLQHWGVIGGTLNIQPLGPTSNSFSGWRLSWEGMWQNSSERGSGNLHFNVPVGITLVGNIGKQGFGNPKGQQQTSRISSPLETETKRGRVRLRWIKRSEEMSKWHPRTITRRWLGDKYVWLLLGATNKQLNEGGYNWNIKKVQYSSSVIK